MFASIFPSPKPVIAVIHAGALPGTPAGRASVSELVEHAREEARLYKSCGVNGLIIENMHDVPYLPR
jgi:predicted TIM-barrel enzyme